jgi:hypothetical protein
VRLSNWRWRRRRWVCGRSQPKLNLPLVSALLVQHECLWLASDDGSTDAGGGRGDVSELVEDGAELDGDRGGLLAGEMSDRGIGEIGSGVDVDCRFRASFYSSADLLLKREIGGGRGR